MGRLTAARRAQWQRGRHFPKMCSRLAFPETARCRWRNGATYGRLIDLPLAVEAVGKQRECDASFASRRRYDCKPLHLRYAGSAFSVFWAGFRILRGFFPSGIGSSEPFASLALSSGAPWSAKAAFFRPRPIDLASALRFSA